MRSFKYIDRYKQNYKNKRIQFVLFDLQGNIIESCDTLVNISLYQDVSIFDLSPFLESIKDVLASLILNPDKIELPLTYPRLEIPLLTREGVFDYSFETFTHPETKEKYIVWIIEDNTDLYQYLWKVQQERNETAIRKELIVIQTQKIIQLHRSLQEKTHELHVKEYELKNQLVYTQKVQQTLLANSNKLNTWFADHFVLFLPKNTATSSLYYANQIKHNQQTLQFVSLLHCTASGITGSFLTTTAIFFLREIIEIEQLIQPHLVLDSLRSKLLNIFQIENKQFIENLEIALLCIDTAQEQISFASAKTPLWLIQQSNLQKHEGSNFLLLCPDDQFTPFEQSVLPLYPCTKLYLTTQGYLAQTNIEQLPIGVSHFENLILQHAEQSMAEQKQILHAFFEQWKIHQEQTDDVLVIGLQPIGV
ncbi:MAG: SpoIIE family protein phosphatase [Microscillaceae bacterium]|nr:SpoIIE family protein phosphatase [Microscillaceae bacterium]MDW8461200.1 hypothetical protein [Cytophagales bacterium]